jgi:hypothetical protein
MEWPDSTLMKLAILLSAWASIKPEIDPIF